MLMKERIKDKKKGGRSVENRIRNLIIALRF
jgi:hypothetical protein